MSTVTFESIQNPKKIKEKLVKILLDVIILTMLTKEPQYGYKLIADIHLQFGVFLSPGTLYPFLYDLEAKGFLTSNEESRRKVYTLTDKGQKEVLTINRQYKSNISEIFQVLDNI